MRCRIIVRTQKRDPNFDNHPYGYALKGAVKIGAALFTSLLPGRNRNLIPYLSPGVLKRPKTRQPDLRNQTLVLWIFFSNMHPLQPLQHGTVVVRNMFVFSPPCFKTLSRTNLNRLNPLKHYVSPPPNPKP